MRIEEVRRRRGGGRNYETKSFKGKVIMVLPFIAN
jgi:hypothetical protein